SVIVPARPVQAVNDEPREVRQPSEMSSHLLLEFWPQRIPAAGVHRVSAFPGWNRPVFLVFHKGVGEFFPEQSVRDRSVSSLVARPAIFRHVEVGKYGNPMPSHLPDEGIDLLIAHGL